MRILPDLHFRDSYKKHYDENYAKIQAGIKNFNENISAAREARKNAEKISFEGILAGIIAFLVMLLMFAISAKIMSSQLAPRREQIASLKTEISEIQSEIDSCSALDYGYIMDQATDIVYYITSFQNQYLSREFDDSFKLYADRFMGSNNYNWLADAKDKTRDFSDPVWKGYLNKTSKYSTDVTAVFIMYDEGHPVCIVDSVLQFDDSSNYVTMKSNRKRWFV